MPAILRTVVPADTRWHHPISGPVATTKHLNDGLSIDRHAQRLAKRRVIEWWAGHVERKVVQTQGRRNMCLGQVVAQHSCDLCVGNVVRYIEFTGAKHVELCIRVDDRQVVHDVVVNRIGIPIVFVLTYLDS